MSRRWIGWSIAFAALAVMAFAYLTDPKERTGRKAPSAISAGDSGSVRDAGDPRRR